MGAATSVDQLQIDIQAQSTRANDALDRLVAKLDKLSTSLGKIDGSKITGLANGVSKLGSAMQGMNNIKTADFTRLASNLQKLGNINVSALNSSASSISLLSKSFNGLGTVSQNAQAVGEMAKNISKLGNKGVQQGIANMPNLATAIKNFMQTLSTAPNVSQNIIQMTNALAKLTAQGSKVGTLNNSLFGGLNRTGSAMTRTTKKTFSLSSAIGRFYQTYYLAIRGIKKLWESIEGTADYIEAYNYYNVAFGKIASEWKQDFEKFGYENAEAYAESFTSRMNETLGKLSGVQIDTESGLLSDTGMKNLGLNIKEITQYASQLASVTNSVGQTGEISLAAASSFTKLAGDISSLFNLDYSTVATNLQSGLIGQSRALYKYGIDITNATLQTYAYELGLSKAVSEMTQAEKMQLRMIAILDQSRVSWGDQANTLNSVSNMVRQLKNNASELASVFGQLFVPALQKVLPVINGASIALKRLVTDIAGLFGIKIDLSSFGQGYSDVSDGLGDIEDGLDGVANAAEKATKGLQGYDELNNFTTSASSSGASAGSGIDLTDEIIAATEEYEKVWAEAYEKMESKAQMFADKISQYLEPLKKLFKDFAIGDWFAVGEDTSNLVSGIFNFFSDAIARVNWYELGHNIGLFLEGVDWTDILSSIGNLIWNAINAGVDLWKGVFDAAPLETTILTAVGLLKFTGLGSALFSVIKNAVLSSGLFTKIGTLFAGGFANFGTTFATVFGVSLGPVLAVVGAITALAAGLGIVYAKNEEVRKGFSDSINSVKEGLQPAVEFFSGTVLPNLASGWERLKDILSPLADFLSGMFTSIWTDMINPAISYIGETVLPKLTEAFENLWKNVLVPLGSLLGDVLTPIIEIVSDVLTILWKNVVVPLAGAIGNVLGKAFDGLVDVFNYVIDGIKPLIKTLQFLWDNVLSPIVKYLKETFKPVFETVFKAIGGIISGLGTTLGGVIDFIAGAFTGNWKKAWNGIVDVFKGIFNGIISVIEGVLNLAITGINKFLKKFDGVSEVISVVAGKNISVPQISKITIPRFEDGGFPKKADLFWANENGKPEWVGSTNGKTSVASNDMITQAIEAAAYNGFKRALAEQNGFGNNVTIQVEGDPNGMFRAWKKEWNTESRRLQKNPVTIYT